VLVVVVLPVVFFDAIEESIEEVETVGMVDIRLTSNLSLQTISRININKLFIFQIITRSIFS
jgi:hypothetical protein